MSDPRAELLRTLKARALELPPAARRAFVEAKCGADADLLRELARALVAAGDAQFAAVAAAPTVAPAPAPPTTVGPAPRSPRDPFVPGVQASPASAQIGERIGPYTLLQVIGEGGFGTVFLAEQKEPVARQVAFKMLKPGMDSAQVVGRFEQERQALAMMDHPNIAKVFDAGTTARGLPYFVMELCRGEPLVTWCDKNRWTVEQRLALFVQVCQAVQHAHGKGIIHRDLKPSNILVGMQDGTPLAKVIDFGIAKALSSKLTERTLFTAVEQVIGTLQYMSPEQAEGSLDIDTRADVYSLGIVLYEVLTGSTPFDDPTADRPSQLELHRRIREQEPHKPSTRLSSSRERLELLAQRRRTEPRRLSAQLRGELDWIVMKAIDRDRTRRYPTAQELAQDVQRFLDGAPVLAAPPSRTYLLRKFVRRNRALVTGGAAVGLALIVGAVAFAWQASVAREQRDFAVQAQTAESVARQRAEDVAGIMEGIFGGLDPTAESDLGVPFRDQLLQHLEGAVGSLAERKGDPLTRARLQVAFGKTLLGLSDYTRAEALLREAVATRRELLGATHVDTVTAEESLSAAVLRLGRAEESVKMLERMRDEGGMTGADLMLGMAYRSAGRLPDAIAALERERDRLAKLGGPDTADGLLALHSLGACYREAGRVADAVPLLQDVLRRRTELLGATQADTLTTANSLAVALGEVDRREESLALYTKTRDQMLQRFAPDHEAVVSVEANMATALGMLGRAAEGVTLLEEARRRCLGRFAPDHPNVIRIDLRLSRLYHLVHRDEEALALLRPLQARVQAMGAAGEPWAHDCTVAIARCLAPTGRIAEAIAMLTPEIEALRRRGDEDTQELLVLRMELGVWQRQAGSLDAAKATLADVLARRRRVLGEQHAETIGALVELGITCFRQKDSAGAIAAFEPALAARERVLGADHDLVRFVRANLGSAYWQAGQLDRSVPILRAALASAERAGGATAHETLASALDLAINLRDAKLEDELFAHLRQWLGPIFRGADGLDPRALRAFEAWFLRRCQETGRFAEAVDALEGEFEGVSKAVDADDPVRLTIGNTLASAYWFAKRFDRSVPLLEDLAERTKRVLGADDPRTLLSAYNLGVNLRDGGRASDALVVFEDLVGRVRSGALERPADYAGWQRELAKTQLKCGQRDRARQTVAESVATARSGATAGGLDSALVTAGQVLLEAAFYDDAEPLLRECVQLRERAQPKAWNTSYARVLLGSCLHGLHRDDEARTLLVEGCTGLREVAASVPMAGRSRLGESAERLLSFFADVGDEAAAAPWRQWRDELAKDGAR